MHTDMGYWRKQGTQNTSICSGSSGEAACRSEKDGGEEKKRLISKAQGSLGLPGEKKTTKYVLRRGGKCSLKRAGKIPELK